MAEFTALYVLGCLPQAERAEFESHLSEGCLACDAELSQVSSDIAALAQNSAQQFPAGMRERFVARMKTARAKDEGKATSLTPGVLFNSSGVLIARTEAMDWQAGAIPGIWAKPLFVDKQRQFVTSLVCMEPGTRYAAHRHYGPEELFLLSGDLVVEGQKMRSGDYCHAEAGSIHGQSYTESGCLFVLKASGLDEVLLRTSRIGCKVGRARRKVIGRCAHQSAHPFVGPVRPSVRTACEREPECKGFFCGNLALCCCLVHIALIPPLQTAIAEHFPLCTVVEVASAVEAADEQTLEREEHEVLELESVPPTA